MARSTLLDIDVRLVAKTGEKTPGGRNMSSFVQPIEMKESSGRTIKSCLARLAAASDGESDDVDACLARLAAASDDEGEDEDAWLALLAAVSDSEPEGALVGWVREGLVRVAVDEPTRLPDILTVSLHLPATPAEIARQLQGVTVVAANGHFMVLSTGPKLYAFASSGHYLVCKIGVNERPSLLPPIDWDEYREDFGRVPVLAGNNWTFQLALVLFSRRTKKHFLFFFSKERHGWIRNEVSLPNYIAEYPFRTDVAFPLIEHPLVACWVDLNLGILICESIVSGPILSFVPLPEVYQIRSFPMARGQPNVHSTVGFVDGYFKLVYMDGYDDEKCPRNKITISTWTYKGNFGGKLDESEIQWVQDPGTPLHVTDFWSNVSRAIPGLPKRRPMCPILSPLDRNIIYFFCSDIDYVNGHIATKGEHLFRLNMKSKMVDSWNKWRPGRSFELIPSLMAIDLSAFSYGGAMGTPTVFKRPRLSP